MDRQQENNDRQKSSVDRVNDLINNAKNVRNNYKNLRRGYKALKTARTAATAARTGAAVVGGAQAVGATGAAGTGAVAGGISGGTAAAIIFLILLIIFLIIMIFVVIFGGNQNVNAGTPPECTTVGGACGTTCQSPNVLDTSGASCSASLTGETQVCCVPPPAPTTVCQDLSPANPAMALKQDWNVVVRGTSNIASLTTIYKILCSTNSSNYQRLLKKGGDTLYIDVPYCTGIYCISFTSTNNIKLSGFFSLGLSYSSQRYLLIHESGHVVCKRNPQLCNQFSNTTLAGKDGTSCYQYNSTRCTGYLRSGNFVRSYALRYYCDGTCWTSITAHNESFAEAIANYLFSSRDTNYYRCSIPISSVNSQCPNTNAWIKTYIYGG